MLAAYAMDATPETAAVSSEMTTEVDSVLADDSESVADLTGGSESDSAATDLAATDTSGTDTSATDEFAPATDDVTTIGDDFAADDSDSFESTEDDAFIPASFEEDSTEADDSLTADVTDATAGEEDDATSVLDSTTEDEDVVESTEDTDATEIAGEETDSDTDVEAVDSDDIATTESIDGEEVSIAPTDSTGIDIVEESDESTTVVDSSVSARRLEFQARLTTIRSRFAAFRAQLFDVVEARQSDAQPIILGGTNELGFPVDAINADFTRDSGSLPVTNLSVENLGTTEDGNVRIRVTQTNLAPENGIFLTPTFVAVQDGTYDLYDRGGTASPGLEILAEDGGVDGVISQFEASGAVGETGVISGSVGGDPTPLAPGATGSIELEIDPTTSRFLTFAQMVLPSNDAFIASPGDPEAIEIFDTEGNFIGADFTVFGRDVLDAGTEVNTEMDAAFINQTAPNTGETEGGVIRRHIGFIGSERFSGSSSFTL